MSLSIFEDKDHQPTENDLQEKLADMYPVWKSIESFVDETYPVITRSWSFAKSYGWNLRVISKKRTVHYFTPCDGNFKIGLVYGEKATNAAYESDIPEKFKTIIREAPVYGEGRGMRVDITSPDDLGPILEMIRIKMKN